MSGTVRRWRIAFWSSAALSLLLALSLMPYLTSSTEQVRLRNALLYEPVAAEAGWTPATPPAGYRIERAAPTKLFVDAVAANRLVVPDDDWQTALNLGRHLLQGVVHNRGHSGPIQAGLAETYGRITQRGQGYCGDYVDAFTALATSAGLFTRSWAFSFDGFGGHGHIFNEIWDRQAGKWRMIDVFNNAYVVDESGEPMSALAFHRLLQAPGPIAWRRVHAEARPGFVHAEKADEYYRRGATQWYLWWGNNVYEYDSAPLVGRLGAVSNSLSQLTAITLGVHPEIRVLAEPANAAMRERLQRVGWHARAVMILLPVFALLSLVCAIGWLRARRAEDAS